MTQHDLHIQLADYMAPTKDQGFSESIMQSIRAETDAVELSDYVTPPSSPWRSWIIALTLGLVAGLIWTWLGVSLPELPAINHEVNLLSHEWGLYAMAAFCMAISLIFVGVDTA